MKDLGNLERTASIDKIPPQNLEAEVALLGSMLIEPQAIGKAVELIREDYFYQESHRKIYAIIVELYDNSKPVDLVTASEALKKKNILDAVGGASYLASLAEAVPTAANVEHYARIVKEKYLLRKLINTSTTIISESYMSSSNVDALLDRAEQLIFEIASDKIESHSVPLKEIIKANIETIENLYQRKEAVTGLATGFRDFDIKTSGLQSSDLIIVAGRPSMGKSAFVTCLAEHVGIVEKKPVAFFSLEMSKEQLVQRMICSHARVDAHKVRTGFLSQSDWPKLIIASGKLSEAPIFIEDAPSITALELRAKARRLKSQHNIQMIIVDYLQLMQGTVKRIENRQQEISDISRSLKALARELNVPVVAVSQLSRAVEKREGHRPQLSDLRESGAIEQDADLVTLLFREEYYDAADENPEIRGVAEAIIAKQRNGPVGTVKLTFIAELARFEDFAQRVIE